MTTFVPLSPREWVFILRRLSRSLAGFSREERLNQAGPAAKAAEPIAEKLASMVPPVMQPTERLEQLNRLVDEFIQLHNERFVRAARTYAFETATRSGGPKFLGVPVTAEQFQALMKAVGFDTGESS